MTRYSVLGGAVGRDGSLTGSRRNLQGEGDGTGTSAAQGRGVGNADRCTEYMHTESWLAAWELKLKLGGNRLPLNQSYK